MTEPPRRKRFQFHLSTAIVLMFVAGGLIWANTRIARVIRNGFETKYDTSPGVNDIWIGDVNTIYGWPFQTMQSTYAVIEELDGKRSIFEVPPKRDWCPSAIFSNVLIASVILFIIWFLLEHLIRSRASRKGA